MRGGEGGFVSIEACRKGALSANIKLRHRLKNDPEFLKKYKQIGINALRTAYENGKIKHDNFTGKHHTEDTKRKIGLKNSISQTGIKNSQYGTIWITNGIENKKILKSDIIPNMWKRGRTLNKNAGVP